MWVPPFYGPWGPGQNKEEGVLTITVHPCLLPDSRHNTSGSHYWLHEPLVMSTVPSSRETKWTLPWVVFVRYWSKQRKKVPNSMRKWKSRWPHRGKDQAVNHFLVYVAQRSFKRPRCDSHISLYNVSKAPPVTWQMTNWAAGEFTGGSLPWTQMWWADSMHLTQQR